MSLSTHAATSTWNGGTGADWNTSSSWTGGIPASTGTASFAGTTASTATISTAATPTSVGAITVTNTAATIIEGGTVASTLNIGTGGITLGSGGGSLTFGGTGVNALNLTLNGNQTWADNSSAGSLVVTNNVTNASTSTPVTLTLSGSAKGITVNGIISDGSTPGGGTTALLITTSGANVTLNGANTYTGGTTITSTGGTTYFGNATALGTGTLTINSGNIDNLSGGVLDMTGNNPINVNGSFAFGGGSHSMDLGTGNVTFTNNDTVNVVQYGLYLGGNVSFATPTTTLTVSSTDASGVLTFGNDSSASVLSAGGTWSGATTNTLIVNSGATLAFDLANGSTVADNITVNGFLQGKEAAGVTNTFSGAITGAFSQNGPGTSVITGSVSGTTSFTTSPGTIQIGNGTTSGTLASLPTVGSGETLAFDQTNGTTISTNIAEAGTVAGAEGSGIANTLSGAITSTGGFSQTGTGTTVLSNTGDSYSGATAVSAGVLDLTGSLTGATAITVTGGTFLEGSGGVIGGAAASLNVNGGTATLAGTNTYTGPTALTSGTLDVNSAGALGTGTLTITSGTIDDTGSSAVTSPTNNPAINLAGSFTFGGTKNLNLGTGAVTVGGSRTITLNGTASTLTLGGTATNTLAGTTGITTTVNGTGNTLALGAFVLGSANTAAITDTFAGSGNVAIAGAVTNGAGTTGSGLTYSGGGTLSLGGNDSYTGATSVSGGTLILSGNNTSATGATSVGSGATLQLVGDSSNNGGTSGNTNTSISASSALTLASGSTLQLRDNVTNTFAPASITTSGNGTFNFDVNNATSGTGQTLTLAGAIGFGNANQQINVTSSGTGYTLGLGALTHNTTSGGLTFTINATTAAANIASFDYGSYGSTVVLEGGNNITLGGLIFTSNGSETLTVAGANVTFNGGTNETGRNTGNYSINLNSGTLNLNNAGDTTDLDGLTTNFTISGGTLDNTSGAAITEATNATVSLNGSFAFTGSNSLNLGTGAVTFTSSPITITANANTLTMGTLNGSTADPINLTKAGTGTLTFAGVNASYGGAITVDTVAGVLNLGGLSASLGATKFVNNGGTAALGALSSTSAASIDFSGTGTTTTTSTNLTDGILGVAYTVNNGADFAYNTTAGGAIVAPTMETALPTSGATTATGSVYYVTGSQSTGADTIGALRITDTVSGQTLNTGANNLSLTSETGAASGLGGILYSGALGSSDSYAITGTGYVQGTSASNSLGINVYQGTLTIANPMIGSAGSGLLYKYGNGTLVLTGANTYTGTTNVGAGTLDLGNGNTGSFAGTGMIFLAKGATLGLGLANGSTLGASIVDSGAMVGLEATGVTNTISGVINPTGTTLLSQTGGFTQTGAGTTILSAANYYTGATVINAGAIEITNAQALGSVSHPTSGVTVASGGALQMAGGISTTGAYALTLNGTGLASESTPTGALESLSGANTYTGAITLASNASIGADSGSTLTLPGGVTNAGYLLTVTGGGNTTLNGVVSGSGGLTTSGTGTTTLSASSGNTYTGETIVSSGELDLNSSGGFAIQGLGADTVATAPDILVNGGTLKFLANNQLNNSSGAGDVTLSLTSGTVSLNGTDQTLYAFQNSGGTFTTGTGYLTGTGATTTFSGGTNTINAGGAVEDSHFVISGGINTVQGGSPSGGTLYLDPNGLGIVFSNGANLTLNSDNTSAGQISLDSGFGGTFTISTNAASTTASITSAGTGTYAGTINLNDAVADFNIAAGTVPSGAPDFLVSAVIADGSGGPGSVYKTGAGIMAFSGANTYTGGTIISQGTLVAGVSNVSTTSGAFGPKAYGVILGDSNTGTSSPALLITGGVTVSNPITIANYGSTDTIGGSNNSGTANFTGPVTLNKAVTLTAASGGTVAMAGQISGPGFPVTKSGAGTVILANAAGNTYSGGTTVSAGTLYANNTSGVTYSAPLTATRTITSGTSSSATGSGTVTVQSGGTFGGTGTITPGAGTGGVVVQSGGTLASGGVQSNASPYNATSGLTLNNSSASLSSILSVNAGAELQFALGAGSTTFGSGTGYLNFANPETNSSYLNIAGNTAGEVNFATSGAAITVDLTDLTTTAPQGTGLTLRQQNPYLLIQAGADSDYNLVTSGGYDQNGYVMGTSSNGGLTIDTSAFNIEVTALGSATPINNSSNYQNLQLYLYNGDLEVVPEPGTWALMLGGLAMLIVIQRRRSKRG